MRYARPLALRFESLKRIGDDLNRFNDLLCGTVGCGSVLVSNLLRIHDSLEGSAERDDALSDPIRRPLNL